MENWNAYFKPSEILLIYVDSEGNEYEQPASALHKEGALVDPDTEELMKIKHIEIPINKLK